MRVSPTFSDRSQAIARMVFLVSLAALGVIHMIAGEAVTRLFPKWPDAMPGRPYWAHVAGGLIVMLAGMSALRIRPRFALGLGGSLILLAVMVLHLPRSIPTDNFGDEWLNVFKWLAMAAGVFLLADTYPAMGRSADSDRFSGARVAGAKWFLAAFMVGAAILHVRFAEPIALYYIPAYVPWRLFWTYFTAATLAAGAVGLLIPLTGRLAALLTSLMIFLWCPLLHIPRTFAEPRNPGEWCGVFESLAFSAMAFALAHRARRNGM